jgi:hypothetical protein
MRLHQASQLLKARLDMFGSNGPAKQSSTAFIPPLDGEGVALEERGGWGEYPSVEDSPPPDRLAPVDLPARGRYESGMRPRQ